MCGELSHGLCEGLGSGVELVVLGELFGFEFPGLAGELLEVVDVENGNGALVVDMAK